MLSTQTSLNQLFADLQAAAPRLDGENAAQLSYLSFAAGSFESDTRSLTKENIASGIDSYCEFVRNNVIDRHTDAWLYEGAAEFTYAVGEFEDAFADASAEDRDAFVAQKHSEVATLLAQLKGQE